MNENEAPPSCSFRFDSWTGCPMCAPTGASSAGSAMVQDALIML